MSASAIERDPVRRAAPRLAFFLPSLHGGGAERVFLDLGETYVSAGYEVHLVLMNCYPSPLLDVVPAGIKLIDLRCPRLWTSTAALVRYLREQRPDGLIAGMPLANAIAAYARRIAGTRTRLVLTEHNARSIAFSDVARLQDNLLAPPIRFAYRLADCIVGVSTGVAERLRQIPGVRGEQIRVVHNPAYSPRIEQLGCAPAPHPWLRDVSTPVVMGVGRLELQKDFATLLRAFCILRKTRPARLIILGEGSLDAQLRALAQDLGIAADVAFEGFVVNPWAYLSRAAVFALSSVHEGFGNVIVEALALGKPVVSTDCPSGPAEILEDGRWGRLVPMRDPVRLSQAIDQALDAPVAQTLMRRRAREFSLEAASAGYLSALRIPAAASYG
jgi:glycosyltransferase involved in cell wall biosynthesis